MGGKNSKPESNAPQTNGAPPAAAPSQVVYDFSSGAPIPEPAESLAGCPDLQYLVRRCAANASATAAVGSSERCLTLALAALRLLEDPTLKEKPQESGECQRQPFADAFRWSVLSMLRSCHFCGRHTPLGSQARLMPPLRTNFTSSASASAHASGPDGEVTDPIYASVLEKLPPFDDMKDRSKSKGSAPALVSTEFTPPCMRWACDSCVASLYIDRFQATSKEVALIERRTRGFSESAVEFEVVDVDDSRLYEDATVADARRLPGITAIESGIVFPTTTTKQKRTSASDVDGVITINSISLGTTVLEPRTFFASLQFPLNRLKIAYVDGASNARIGDGVWAQPLLNPATAPTSWRIALQTIKHLELLGVRNLTGCSHSAPNALPLRCFTALQTVTINGFCLTENDLDHSGVEHEVALRQAVLVNQHARITLSGVLATLGALPLETLSVASIATVGDKLELAMNNDNKPNAASNNDEYDGQEDHQEASASFTTADDQPPILVANLVLWGAQITGPQVTCILLRCTPLLQVLDISETRLDVVNVLAVCAAAGLSSLRTLRANCVAPPANDAFVLPAALNPPSWAALSSLRELQLARLQRSSNEHGFSRFATLPSVTSIDVSFHVDSPALGEAFLFHVSSIRALITLSVTYSHGASARASSGEFGPITFPNLRKLTVKGMPPQASLNIAHDGCPRLEEVHVCASTVSSMRATDFEALVEAVGKTVRFVSIRVNRSASSAGHLNNTPSFPVASLPSLEVLSVSGGDLFFSSPTECAASLRLLSGATRLRSLSLPSKTLAASGANAVRDNSGALEFALERSTTLTSLDLTDTVGWTGGNGSVARFVPLVLPALKRFIAPASWGRISHARWNETCPDLFRFLAAQPALEIVDVAGAFFCVAASAPRFWHAVAERGRLRYLNISRARTRDGEQLSDAVFASAAAPADKTAVPALLPRSLAVLRVSDSDDGPHMIRFMQRVVDAAVAHGANHLRALWLIMNPGPQINRLDERSWHAKLSALGVQINVAIARGENDESE